MLKKLLLILAVVALVASAGTVPSSPKYKFNISQNSILKGQELKAGDYHVTIADSKAIITTQNGKNPVEVPVKVETQDKKFDVTMVRCNTENGKFVIAEIRIGGTNTRLVFN